ncbi:MAG: SCP2 sterol-binding domain-containing protein [Deltaproteobacteria bacterium]|nr:SCP2 sterol-binding domain-containing protein [Deltaproteobacteria bacterium]
MVRLETENPQTLHLLSLLLRERLQLSLSTPEGQSRARKIKGSAAFLAEGMETRVVFEGERIHLGQSQTGKIDVRAGGTLAAFVALCRGRARVMNVVRRQVRVRGNPLLLMKILPLLRAFDDGAETT